VLRSEFESARHTANDIKNSPKVNDPEFKHKGKLILWDAAFKAALPQGGNVYVFEDNGDELENIKKYAEHHPEFNIKKVGITQLEESNRKTDECLASGEIDADFAAICKKMDGDADKKLRENSDLVVVDFVECLSKFRGL